MRYRAKPELRELIRQQGRKITWLAERLGVAYPQAHNAVSGTKAVAGPRAEKIAGLLGVPRELVFSTEGIRGERAGGGTRAASALESKQAAA